MNTTIRSFAIAAIATIAISSGAFAGYCRPHNPPPPPPPVFRDLDASICLRDDPRAEVTVTNEGDVSAVARIIYFTALNDVRTVGKMRVAPGASRTVTLWVKGGGRPVIVRDNLTNELLARIVVTRRNIGETCP